MAGDRDFPHVRLREQLDAVCEQVLARCMAQAADGGYDEALAEKIAHLIAQIARLPRDRVLALRFLPETGSSTTADAAAAGGISSSPEELVLFRRLADAAGHGFAVTDLKGRIAYINPALCRMLGEPDPQAAIGRSFYEYYSGELRSKLVREFIPAVMQNGQWTGELPVTSLKGATTSTIQNLFLIPAARGTAPYLANLIIDITERKKSEEALRVSEERFRSAFENSSVGMYRTTPDGRILLANRALVGMLGYASFEELAGRNLESEGYEPQYPRVAFKRRMERNGGVSGEDTAWLRRDGTILYVRESARAFRDAAGHILYYEGIAEDITERKRAEEALRASEENFRALAENADDGIFIATGEGMHVFANRRAAEITGYTQLELLNGGFRDLIAPENVARLAERYRRRLAGQEVLGKYETDILRKDGSRVTVEVSGARTVWHGRLADIVIIRDVTERKRAETALRESEERFRGLVENVAEVIYAVDREGRVVYISPTITPISGFEPEEILGRKFTDFVDADDVERARRNMSTLLSGEDQRAHEYRLRFKSNETRWVRVSSRPVREGARVTGVRGVITEIHDLKMTQLALEELEALRATLIDQTSDGIALVQDERICLANAALARMLGYDGPALQDQPLAQLLPPQEREAILARLREDVSAERTVQMSGVPLLTKEGRRIALELRGTIIRHFGRPAMLAFLRMAAQAPAGPQGQAERTPAEPRGTAGRVPAESRGQTGQAPAEKRRPRGRRANGSHPA